MFGSKQTIGFEFAKAAQLAAAKLAGSNYDPNLRDFLIGMHMPQESRPAHIEAVRARLETSMVPANAIAKAFRDHSRARQFKSLRQLQKDGVLSKAHLDSTLPDVMKANLDVGTLTNLASVTGGQSLGYVSLDTQMARGTVRPNSFTIYQCLEKSAAYQVVDFWPYAYDTGAGLPGTDFQGFGNVSSGTLATSAGEYELEYINLKLSVNGRAMTTALAAQNSFVDIAAQETINASLAVLGSNNWACYWGNSTIFSNQFNGIYTQIPSGNTFDFLQFTNNYASAQGWSSAQTLFNLIYEAAAQITSFRNFGRITHAFMSPVAAGALQGLVTTTLNNIVTSLTPTQERLTGVVVDGDLQGMRTRFGEIQFPIDLFITARDQPAQAIVKEDGTNYAVSSGTPVKPTSIAASVSGGAYAGSDWTSAYTAASGIYSYAAAAVDAYMNESTLTYLTGNSVSGVTVSGAITLTVTPASANDGQVAYRIFRSGLGYSPASSGVANPGAYRYIGTVASTGSAAVTFIDANLHIPGSDTIFLLDLDENDQALDFRYLLPLTKIELFAQNLYMPWAVAMIGSVRLKIAKFHGAIFNYVSDNPVFNPLAPNSTAT